MPIFTMLRKFLVLFCALGATAAIAETQPTPATAPNPALTVQLIKPESSSWPRTVPAAGDVTAWQEVVIGAEIGPQQLVDVLAEVGDQVRKGQLLARIADASLNAEVAQAEAALAESEAMLADAQANAERARNLREKGFYSPQQGSQYETAKAAALARRQAAAAALQAARVRLGHTRITAPDQGVISARSAIPGSQTAPGQELFRLIRQGRLEWRAEVAETSITGVRPGMMARLTTSTGRVLGGKVRRVSPSIDPKSRNATVYVDVVNTGNEVRAGMYVRGEIELEATRVLTVPQNALVLRDGFAYAFVAERVDAGGTALVRSRKVELGRRQGDRVAVLSGLTADATIVAKGGGFLTDGDTVRVSAN